MQATTRRDLKAVTLLSGVGALAPLALAQPGPGDIYGPYRERGQIILAGTIRDFTPAAQGGHPDFGKAAATGVGRYVHVAADTLGSDGVPVLGSSGFKVRTNWIDSRSRAIIPSKPYIDARAGDRSGVLYAADGQSVTSGATFSQWFRNVAGVNTAFPASLVLTRESAAGVYVFDGSFDNFRGAADYSYSMVVETPFVFERARALFMEVAGNADTWVYVDNKLVLDNGAGLGARPAIVVQDSFLIDNSAAINVPTGTLSISTNSTAPGAIQVQNSAQVTGDVLIGPGGNPASGIVCARPDGITGVTGALGAPIPVAVISEPVGMPASSGAMVISNAARTLSGDLHYASLNIRVNSTVTIDGATRILVDGNVTLESGSRILLSPGARLEVYSRGSISVTNGMVINTAPASGNADKVVLACLGNGGISLSNTVTVCGHLVAPQGVIDMGQSSTLIGTMTARSANMHNTSSFTASGTFAQSLGGVSLAGRQRIDLDRLAWLTDGRTHRLRLFFANRLDQPSHLEVRSNIDLLNLAALPRVIQND